MHARRALKAALLFAIVGSVCGCDLNSISSLGQRLGFNPANGLFGLGGTTITIRFPGGSDNPDSGQNVPVDTTGGTPESPFANRFPPGDLHFRGSNAQSFLPPVAPSAVGFPF